MCVTQFVLQISNTRTVRKYQFVSDKRHAICMQHYGKVGTKQITKLIVIDLYSMLPRFFVRKEVEGKRTSQIHATTIYSYVTKLKFDLYNTQRIPTGSQKSQQRTLRCCIDTSHV